MAVKCGNCKGYHDSATAVKVCYHNPAASKKETPVTTAAAIVPAHRLTAAYKAIKAQATAVTPAQKEGAKQLAEAVADVVFGPSPTQVQAQVKEEILATVLKGQDLKVDSLYKMGDDVYKVVWNKHKTYKYAMKLVFASWMKKGKFQFAAGVINQLDSSMQMDLDGAKNYAAWAYAKFKVGVCCNCGKLLTNPESVAEGIGPVCSGKIKKSWI